MNTRATYRFLGILSFVLAFSLAGCLSPQPSPTPTAVPTATVSPTPPPSAIAYLEVTWQKYGCNEGLCFSELLLTRSGRMVKKDNYYGSQSRTVVTSALISPLKAADFLAEAKTSITPHRADACKDCSQLHAFYHDGGQTTWASVRQEEADAFLSQAQTRLQALFDGGEAQSPFFVQLVYKKVGETGIQDVHFLSDGTAIHEVFGNMEGELLSVQTKSLDSAAVQSALDGYFGSRSVFDACARAGYEYSYIDATVGTQSQAIYTCGLGDSGADKAFKQLLALVNG